MQEERLQSQPKVVGLKQLRKALQQGRVSEVFLADDADPAITDPIADRCSSEGIPVTHVATMQRLGTLCRIHVGAACAGLLRP